MLSCTRAQFWSQRNPNNSQLRVACNSRARVVSASTSPSASRIPEVDFRQVAEMGVTSSRGAASSSPPSDSKRDVPHGRALPPWILHGRGYVFAFALPKETIIPHSTYAEDPNELVKFVGGLGGFVIADYYDSPVGPYKEFLFVPGMYEYYDSASGRVRNAHGISRIWVDNEKSASDGRANWGIPKELAEFEWREPSSDQAGRVTVRHRSANGRKGGVIFDVVVNNNYSPVSVPILSKVPFLPLDFMNWLPLVQLPADEPRAEEAHLLRTTLSLRAWVKPAAMAEKPRVDGGLLPSVGALYGACISSFELQFKEPVDLQTQSPASMQKDL